MDEICLKNLTSLIYRKGILCMLNSLIGLNLNCWEEIVGGAIQLNVGKAMRTSSQEVAWHTGKESLVNASSRGWVISYGEFSGRLLPWLSCTEAGVRLQAPEPLNDPNTWSPLSCANHWSVPYVRTKSLQLSDPLQPYGLQPYVAARLLCP